MSREKLDFDTTCAEALPNGTALEYGIVHGDRRIVLIKSGRGGNARGEDNKYLRMARRLANLCGCTVICSPNPIGCDRTDHVDRRVIERYVAEYGLTAPSLSLIGSSNGAFQNLLLAAQLERVERILCINMPLMINFHKSLAALHALEATQKVFVYGTRDQSYPYLRFLESKPLSNLRVLRIEGADHCFTGMTDAFVELADLL
jgi:alpha/beta superfamily hydrolase